MNVMIAAAVTDTMKLMIHVTCSVLYTIAVSVDEVSYSELSIPCS